MTSHQKGTLLREYLQFLLKSRLVKLPHDRHDVLLPGEFYSCSGGDWKQQGQSGWPPSAANTKAQEIRSLDHKPHNPFEQERCISFFRCFSCKSLRGRPNICSSTDRSTLISRQSWRPSRRTVTSLIFLKMLLGCSRRFRRWALADVLYSDMRNKSSDHFPQTW